MALNAIRKIFSVLSLPQNSSGLYQWFGWLFSPLMKGGVSGGLERPSRQPPPNLPLYKGEEPLAKPLLQGTIGL